MRPVTSHRRGRPISGPYLQPRHNHPGRGYSFKEYKPRRAEWSGKEFVCNGRDGDGAAAAGTYWEWLVIQYLCVADGGKRGGDSFDEAVG